jgi:transcriptional regulator with XRE-family HTH domain
MPDVTPGVAFQLYQRVERERALKGISTVALSQESGVSRSAVSKWATQSHTPQPEKVNAVADVLGIPRIEALRLAGILLDSDALAAECEFERRILGSPILDGRQKTLIVEAHREEGHGWCQGQLGPPIRQTNAS